MAQQFGAQFEQMQAAAQHVATVNENVQAQLSRLYNQLEPLSRAWQGQAATAFQILMQRWHADARKLSEALTSIGERIRESGVTYAQTDEAEHQSYSRISQALHD
jgi:WXG100 family type VII secretion target